MCKESMHGLNCPGCGERIYFTTYHIPHCKNPRNDMHIAKVQSDETYRGFVRWQKDQGKGVPAASVAG